MDIALITPTSVLNDYCGDLRVHMSLAHRVLADEAYADFFAVRAKTDVVIMDNSLWELGGALDMDVLIKACERIRPTELIVPDVFRDGLATISSFRQFAKEYGSKSGMPWARNFVVVQGKDREEWLECFDFFNEHPHAHTLGLPKVLDETWSPGGRIGCVEFLEATGRIHQPLGNKRYHCLGIWDDPIETLLLARHKWIRSLDTALPIHAGLRDVKFHPELGLSRVRPKRPHVYFEISRDEVLEHAIAISHNVSLLRRWANGRNGHHA